MNLAKLPKIYKSGKKRVGRGYGSGRGGHTSTRGAKGQKARSKVGLFFEGTKVKKSLLKRLPLVRGKGKFKSIKEDTVILSLGDLVAFKKDEEVNLSSLQQKGILPKDLPKGSLVKVLGAGEIKQALSVALPVSKRAKEAIEKAGGKVIERVQ